jgi:hypothetical protein
MAKVIRTAVDAEGNVTTDFSGFVGNECETQDNRLRQSLAEFGLIVQPQSRLRKEGTVDKRQLATGRAK